MKFEREIETIYKNISTQEDFDGKCPFCGSKGVRIRSSRIREIQDLGTSSKKIIIQLDSQTMECNSCKVVFSLNHHAYPPKYQYSKDVIEYALTRFNYHNVSGNDIARDLAFLHNVQVPEVTVYSWLKEHSPEFIKANLAVDPENLPPDIKSLTIDGTYVNMGKELIGKKKDVDSFSVTKLEDGRYLLMWWE